MITPKSDVTISQALPNDTLNFMIPGSLTTGTLTLSCRVFDAANPASKSAPDTRTLVFVPAQPLNIFLVGVTTQKPAATAPTQSAIVSAFTLLRKMYPRGIVQFTGYNVITLADPIAGLMASSGCGTGWSHLLDRLRDLRGGSGDIYFGGLPAGISAAGVIGCSPVGERVAASFIDLVATIPHEVGHSLGLRHDPCRGCTPSAQDPDPNVPQYNTFNSDSIGTFGFDPTTNTVFNPANALDFMTAFLPAIAWISPYRHQGLLGSAVGPSAGGAMTLLGGEHMTLFLGLEIDRERKVVRRASFHHMALMQGASTWESPFSCEFLDADRRILDCGPLHCLCSVGCSCWPKTIRDALPYPEGARHLVVRDGDELIHEEAIPDPPTVEITVQRATKEGVPVTWRSAGAEAYLVHYWDSRFGVWRGAAPRLDNPRFVVPWPLFGREQTLRVRVLASSGIATGYAEVELKAGDERPPEVSLTLPGGGPTGEGPTQIPPVVNVLATDASGAQLPDAHLSWYDGHANRIGRGAQLDLRQLPDGQSVVRVVVRGHGGRTAAKSWAVERRGDDFFLRAVICDPPRRTSEAPHQHPHPVAPPCEE